MSEETFASFAVSGTPEVKQRPRVTRGGKRTFTPKDTLDAERIIADTFRLLYPDWKPTDKPVRLKCEFWLPDGKRKDLDNLGKLVMDALNGIAYLDDSQIVETIFKKHTPDKLVQGSKGRMRKRRPNDPITFDGLEYPPHTEITIVR